MLTPTYAISYIPGFFTVIRPYTVRFFFQIENPTVRFGAVIGKRKPYDAVRCGLRYCKSYGAVRCCDISYCAVRCGLEKSKILRCGPVRFSKIVKATVRFVACMYPTVRFGAVFRYCISYGAVRCCDKSNGAVRCGSPLNAFCYGAGPIPVGNTVRNRFSLRCTV